jgi:hypothetical protein
MGLERAEKDMIISKYSVEYENNWDAVFGKKETARMTCGEAAKKLEQVLAVVEEVYSASGCNYPSLVCAQADISRFLDDLYVRPDWKLL